MKVSGMKHNLADHNIWSIPEFRLMTIYLFIYLFLLATLYFYLCSLRQYSQNLITILFFTYLVLIRVSYTREYRVG